MRIPPTIAGFGRHRKKACEDRGKSLRPGRLSRVGSSEDLDERGNRILETDDGVETIAQCERPGEIAISPVAVTEAERAAPSEVPEPDVGEANPGEGVEEVELLEGGEIALDGAMWQGAMFSPLDVDGDLSAVVPVGVQQGAVPEGPDVGGGAGRVVADPDDFFVGGDGEGDPGAVNVVLPEQVVADDAPGGVDDGDDALQGEPFVALDV